MKLDVRTLASITGKPVNDNMRSVVAGLDAYGHQSGLDQPHRLAHYLAQLLHESGAFRFDKELWGPTPAQKGYDTRKDLGNTPERDGDGELYKGRGPIQLTGKRNYTAFHAWASDAKLSPPNFVLHPDTVNTDPWEGLTPIWYWMVGNPTGKSLNRFADANDIETVTKRINGGLNGFDDRINWYVKAALVLAGYAPGDVKGFQADAQAAGLLPPDTKDVKQVDGDAGPKTRSALHMTLAAVSTSTAPVKAAPVVAEVAVVPENAEKVAVNRTGGVLALVSPLLAGAGSLFAGLNQTGVLILLGVGLLGVVILLWRGELIAARARSVIKSFEEPGA